ISRQLFGWSQTARQVASAVTSPLIGKLIDRHGSRVLLAFAAAITGLAMVGLAFMQHGWLLVPLFGVMGLVGMGGPGSLVTAVPVAKWFVRKRGRAMSFMALGIPVGGVIFVPLTQLFIDGIGWRWTWVVMAAIGAGLIIPLSLWLVRRHPEDMGLRPDGDPSPALTAGRDGRRSGRAAPNTDEVSWTVKEAARSPAFWSLVVVFSLTMLAMSSVGLHRIPHFMDQGLDPRLVAYATALDALAAGVSTFALGMLVDRYPAQYVGAAGFGLLAFAIYLTIIADTTALMFAAMLTFGMGVGSLMLLRNFMIADYFGRKHLGGIQGVMMPITLVFGGAGAPLAGFIRDAIGTYNPIWWGGLGLMVAGGALLALTPKPVKGPAARGTEPPAPVTTAESLR
ncbi:MAG: MFS transporter, partial [SAR202 cluster bacterium]|nr:MFS transporter [SAR202 cluster bacterium]